MSEVANEKAAETTECCDGTGWTGEDGVICSEHYEPIGYPWTVG